MTVKGKRLMSKRNEGDLIFLGALFLMGIVLIALLASSCNASSGTTVHYPKDSTHGYYDSQHHWHYYPKYGSGTKVVPAPKRKAPSLKKR